MKSKKQQRQEAINAEIKRREQERLNKSPIDRTQMLSLVEFVGKRIIENGHDHNFKYAKEWADKNSIKSEDLISFLNGEKIKDDWDLAVSADPYDFFGTTDNRLSWMPLEHNQLNEMLHWLDTAIQKNGCNHNYDLAKEWLSSKPVDTSTTLMALMAKGGGCDCEIVLNVEVENIYP